ncbi:MAG: BrnT family toxin [bacterium]|nr:BrnT family toxin [bacterium]MBU1916947.1 BrnT family toxin [bacterium]
MEFEFDKSKSEINKRKHGIDFVQAQSLWFDPNRIYIKAKTSDEQRFILIGKRKTKHWSAIYTLRDNKVRLISVRRARKEDVNIYES